ncbi:DUF3426 domain-containing protein [Pelotalea chapellei]|uniref:Zinc-ribbon domain-containing protein n=1 Tax=Pelotalea chapellei TaxID=44671 RepID=A0ABS5UBZ9_9BACT|nr:DUF3426 domain-containing protein [Pelotalea chapellei]MBT1073227.1 zinc-ribbon domain-containing protein [Pelotalea chapellei]
MIIQCEQCNTKFRLDDSRVTAKGVKVRCAKCKHVFSVSKEQPINEETPSDFGALLDQKTDATPDDQTSSPDQTYQPPSSAPSDFETSSFGEVGFSDNTFGAPEVPQNQEPAQPAESSSFSFLDEPTFPSAQDEPLAGDSGFSTFEFGDLPDTPQEQATESAAWDGAGMAALQSVPELPTSTTTKDSNDFDLGSDNLFGDAVAPAHEEPNPNLDFQMDEFAESLGIEDAADEKGTAEKPRSEEPFSLGDIDFGDELSSVAVQQVHPDELKPGQDLLFAPLGTAAVKEAPTPPQPEEHAPPHNAQDELPPLSISSRRKQSSLVTALLGILGIIAVAGMGFYGYTTLRGQTGTIQDAGRITLRAITASYVKNSAAGNILVINGEAVNEYKKPRAAIQVKGMVYGSNGQVLSSKAAYGGNPLTPEQLATMPMEKIEAAMANQFGDSLANLEVAPGKAIPFTIVIPSPPAGAKDYGVESTGSTVATGKQ